MVIRFFIHINEKNDWFEKISGPEEEKQGQEYLKSRSLKVEKSTRKTSYLDSSNKIDVKGAIALAVTIVSLLLVLTLLETSGNSAKTTSGSYPTNEQNFQSTANSFTLQVLPFIKLGIISFSAFIFIEKRPKFPLVNFKLMLNRAILASGIIKTGVIRMFNIYSERCRMTNFVKSVV